MELIIYGEIYGDVMCEDSDTDVDSDNCAGFTFRLDIADDIDLLHIPYDELIKKVNKTKLLELMGLDWDLIEDDINFLTKEEYMEKYDAESDA